MRVIERSWVTEELVLSSSPLLVFCGNDPGGNRTHDLRLKRPLLYRLSYRVRTTENRRREDEMTRLVALSLARYASSEPCGSGSIVVRNECRWCGVTPSDPIAALCSAVP
jgi:hypothetical protein